MNIRNRANEGSSGSFIPSLHTVTSACKKGVLHVAILAVHFLKAAGIAATMTSMAFGEAPQLSQADATPSGTAKPSATASGTATPRATPSGTVQPSATPSATASGTKGPQPPLAADAQAPFEGEMTDAQAEEKAKETIMLMLGILRKDDEQDTVSEELRSELDQAEARQGRRRGLLARANGFSDEITALIAEVMGDNERLREVQAELTPLLKSLTERVCKAGCITDKMICDLNQVACLLRQVNCILCSLPGKIRRAKVRAFIFGFVLGLGLGVGLAGIGGGAGAAVSAPFFNLFDDKDLLLGYPTGGFSRRRLLFKPW